MVPAELGYLKTLRILNLSNNQLIELPSGIVIILIWNKIKLYGIKYLIFF